MHGFDDVPRSADLAHATGSWHKVPGVPDWEKQMTEWLNTALGHHGPVGEGIRRRVPPPATTGS